MTDYIFSIILLIIALIAIELRKIYHALPKNEIRFRARHGDPLANKIYHAVSYEESLEILLWSIILLASAGSLILLNSVAPLWLDFVVIVIYLGLTFAWLPKVKYNSISDKLANYFTPAIVWILNYLHPTFQKVYRVFTKNSKQHSHTGIYDQEGLSDLLEKQKSQPDNRISKSDLELVTKSLDLSKKVIGDYQKNWTEVFTVKSSDSIGPILLDELHKSDQQFVPVIDEENEVVGVLEVARLDITSSGQVKDHMDSHVHYLEEDQSLQDALRTITKASRLVYIVKDNKDKNLGVITLSDILGQLLVEEPEEFKDAETSQDNEELPEEESENNQQEDAEQINETEETEINEDNEPEVV